MVDNNKCWCECKNALHVKNNMFGILVCEVAKMENI